MYISAGITLTGGRESKGTNAVSHFNIIKDYSYITPNKTGLLFRCVSGLGPMHKNNSELGGLYVGSTEISSGGCDGPMIQPRGATIRHYVGIINIFLCRKLTPNNEGVYNCTMKNSSLAKESVRVGVYLPGRSKFCCVHKYIWWYRLMVGISSSIIKFTTIRCNESPAYNIKLEFFTGMLIFNGVFICLSVNASKENPQVIKYAHSIQLVVLHRKHIYSHYFFVHINKHRNNITCCNPSKL